MHRLAGAFARIREGEWFCRAPITFFTPSGEITTTPGVLYRKGQPVQGVDVAAVLDVWHSMGKLPPDTVLR